LKAFFSIDWTGPAKLCACCRAF